MATSKSDLTSVLGNFETTLNEYFVKKAPFQLPDGVKEFIVAFGPWITLILLILALPALLLGLGLGALVAPFAVLGGAKATFGLPILISLVALVLEAIALPGLFKRKKSGWNFLFYSTIVSIVGSLVGLDFIGAILGAVIGWYFLFQIRSYYK